MSTVIQSLQERINKGSFKPVTISIKVHFYKKPFLVSVKKLNVFILKY